MPGETGMGQVMRPWITPALAALVLGTVATGALAQSPSLSRESAGLPLRLAPLGGASHAFAHPDDPIGRLLDRAPLDFGVRWDGNQLSLTREDGSVDSLRISIGGALRPPGGLPIHLDRAEFEAQA